MATINFQEVNVILDLTPGRMSYLAVDVRKEDLQQLTNLEEVKPKCTTFFIPSCKGCGDKIKVNIFLDKTTFDDVAKSSLKAQESIDRSLKTNNRKISESIRALCKDPEPSSLVYQKPSSSEHEKASLNPFKIANVSHNLPKWNETEKTADPLVQVSINQIKIEPEDYTFEDTEVDQKELLAPVKSQYSKKCLRQSFGDKKFKTEIDTKSKSEPCLKISKQQIKGTTSKVKKSPESKSVEPEPSEHSESIFVHPKQELTENEFPTEPDVIYPPPKKQKITRRCRICVKKELKGCSLCSKCQIPLCGKHKIIVCPNCI